MKNDYIIQIATATIAGESIVKISSKLSNKKIIFRKYLNIFIAGLTLNIIFGITLLSGSTAGKYSHRITSAERCFISTASVVDALPLPENAPITTISNVSVCDGFVSVDFQVSVAGFTNNIAGISLSMTCNPDQLGTPALLYNPLGLVFSFSSSGIITIGGYAPAGQGFNLNDSILLILRFTKVTSINTGSLAFNDTNGISCEYAKYDPNDTFSYLPLNDYPSSTYYINGGVMVNPLPSETIIGNNSPVCSGTEAIYSLTGTADALVFYSFDGGTTTSTTTLTGGTATLSLTNTTVNKTLTLISVINPSTNCSQSMNSASTVVVNTCANPCNILVANTNNAGAGSLRDAIANVCNNGTLNFASGINGQTIYLSSAIVIDKNITLDNCNHVSGIIISGSGNNFIINTGVTLSLSGCSKFSFTGCIQNNNGVNGLLLNSGASLIINCCGLAATAKRDLTPVWHLFGSPFVKNTQAMLSGLVPPSGSAQLKPYTNGTGWGTTTNNPLFQFTPLAGNAVKPGSFVTATLKGYLFCNNLSPVCDIYVNLVYNGTSSMQSWNLLSNPFPTYLNWKLLGRTNVNPTLYLWDNSLYPGYNPVTNATYMRTYNATTNVGVPSNTSPYIAPMQGFFVRAIYTNPKLTFPLTAKTHTTSTYYKDGMTQILVRLKAETDEGIDELVVCKNDNSSLGLENFDSEKLYGDLPVQMYSQASSGERLVINTINETKHTVIPLGLIGGVGQKAKITSFALESGIPVYLEDRLKGKLISLSENMAYEFDFPAENLEGRFFLRFGINATPLNSSITVFKNTNNELNVIALSGENIASVTLYSVTGVCVYKSDCNKNIFTAKLNLATGVYMIKIKTVCSYQNHKLSWIND